MCENSDSMKCNSLKHREREREREKHRNLLGGHIKPTSCYVSSEHGSSPQPETCSLTWVFMDEFLGSLYLLGYNPRVETDHLLV
jgi:hypothetical protein